MRGAGEPRHPAPRVAGGASRAHNPSPPMIDDPLDRAPLRLLVGPTASGKSDLAPDLAEALGAEIASLDSMLVYRGMDVGTAKPGRELRARIRHHLIDLVEPSESYSVSRYVE